MWYVCVCVYVCVCACVHLHMCMCGHAWVHVGIHVYYVYECVCVCVCVCVSHTIIIMFNIQTLSKLDNLSTVITSDLPRSSDPLSDPSLKVRSVAKSVVQYRALRNDATTYKLITGYEVIRFGVSMIGEYVNTGRGWTVTISPAVPSAQYRITAWALAGGNRSTAPAVEHVTTGEARECGRPVYI